MRTVIASDLHLGSGFKGDLVRRPRFRDTLITELADADRVVLLGDVLELRDRPVADVLATARPFFEQLGEAVGETEVVIVPGNHDHQLLAPWLDARRLSGSTQLGLEQMAEPESGAFAELARSIGRADLVLAYPGLWIRPDVYATHGHYLDCHITIPTFERIGIAVTERLTGRLPSGLRTADDYEAVQWPLYDLLYGMAQSSRGPRRGVGGNASARVWESVHGKNGRPPGLRGRLIGSVVIPGAVALANRAGLGPLRFDISLPQIRVAGVRAMGELTRRLGIEAEYVIFGHTHRRGPIGDDPEFAPRGLPQLMNTGSWVYAPALLQPRGEGDPFWPGTLIAVEDDEPPELRHLLDEVPHAEFRRELS